MKDRREQWELSLNKKLDAGYQWTLQSRQTREYDHLMYRTDVQSLLSVLRSAIFAGKLKHNSYIAHSLIGTTQ